MLKRVLSALLALLMLLGMATALAADPVSLSTDTGIDIVVVIDRSGTMKDMDPKNIALAATNALAEISSVDGSTNGGVSMALITYGYGILTNTQEFYRVSDPASLQKFEASVSSNAKVDNWEDTNTGLALSTAYEVIEKQRTQHPNHKFAVVLLSDGQVDVGTSTQFLDEFFPGDSAMHKRIQTSGTNASRAAAYPEWDAKRQEVIAASKEMGKQAAQNMANDGIPLYCIGIYKDNDQSKLGTDMQEWAELTGGEGNYRITNNIGEVDTMMNDLYGQINDQAEFTELVLTADAPAHFSVGQGVLQVNIRVTPQIDDFDNTCSIVQDATGASVPCSAHTSGADATTYTIISISQPEAGNYTMSINDGNAHTYNLAVFSIYDLKLSLEGGASVANGETTRLQLRVTKDGAPFYDNTLQLPKLYIRSETGTYSESAPIPMQWDANEQFYWADFTPSQPGNYYAYAELETSAGRNVSAERKIIISNAPVRPNGTPFAPVEFRGHAIQVYDASGNTAPGYAPVELSHADIVSGYFDNMDNLPVTGLRVQLENNTDANGGERVHVDNADGKIVITPLASANQGDEVRINIYVQYTGSDAGTESEPISGTILVEDLQNGAQINPNYVLEQPVEVAGLMPTEEMTVVDNVHDLFYEPNANDGEDYSVEIAQAVLEDGTPANDVLDARINGGRLVLTGKADGSVKLTLRATGYDGRTADCVIDVSVVNRLPLYLMIGGGALALIVLIVILIVAVNARNKPAFPRGSTLTVELTMEDDSSVGVAMLQRYGKKAVKLSTMCSANGIHMGNLRTTLDKILIVPRKRGGIVIRRNLKGGKKETVLQPLDNWRMELDDERMIELSYDEN